MSEFPASPDYSQLLAEVKERIRCAQYAALKAVNTELVGLYWDLGRMIVERQDRAGWGKSVVEQLSDDLRQEFPGVGGFSASNLWRMKAFFELYRDQEKLAPLVREIGWSHNLAIMERCSESLEREFYLRMTRKFGWSKNVLIHQIKNQSYEKSMLGQTNFDQAVSPELRAQAKLAVKDEYTFDFLELGAEHSERELERALILKVEDFLRAMGGMFAFMGSQYRLEVDGREFFIDLLLFHRRLRCLVAIELKVGDFQPEFVGKMQFYLTALDRQTVSAMKETLGAGGSPKTRTQEYWDGEIPFFTPRDAPDCFYVQDTDKHVTEPGRPKCASQLYPPDTVFITARGTVGKVALPSVPMAMNQSCYALRGKPGFSQRFLFLMTLQRQVQTLRRTRDLLLPRLLSGQIDVEAMPS